MLHFVFFILALILGILIFLSNHPFLALGVISGVLLYTILSKIHYFYSQKKQTFTSFFSSDIFRYTGSSQGILRFRKKLLQNIKELQEYKILILKSNHEIVSYPNENIIFNAELCTELEMIYQKALNKPLFLGKRYQSFFLKIPLNLNCYAYSYCIPVFNSRVIILACVSPAPSVHFDLKDDMKLVNDLVSMLVFLSEFSREYHGIFELLQETMWESPYAVAICNPKGELIMGNNALFQLFQGNIPNLSELTDPEVFLLLLDGKRIGKTFAIQGRRIHFEAYPLNNKNFLVTKCLFVFFDEQVENKRELLGETNTLRRFTSENSAMGSAMFTVDGTLLYSNAAFMKNLYIFKVREAKQKSIFDLFKLSSSEFKEIVKTILNGKLYSTSLLSIEKEFEFNVSFKGIVFGDQTILEVILEESFTSEHHAYLDKETQGLYEELQTARSVQEHILSLPTIYRPGVAVDTLYIPSRQLSGDFFTVIPFDNDQMGFLIADVSGHGVSASLITAALKILIKFAPSDSNSLPKIISYFNTYLADILPEGSFVTLFYGIVDFQEYTFRYINCGHPFPILEDVESGETKILEGMGFPLGGLLNVAFDEHIRTIQLPRKSKLFFYTDGILQHLAGPMKEKLEKMCGVITKTKAINDKNLLKTIYKHLVSRNSSIPEDDVSMMLVNLDQTCTKKHHLTISSTLIEVDEVIKEISGYIQKETNLDPSVYWRLHTCFYEALLNAVVHGNKYNTQKKVYIDFRIVDDLVVIRIRDEGTGFDFNDISNPFETENILKDFGRGITMIKTLADRIKFNGKGNEITLFFYRSGRKS